MPRKTLTPYPIFIQLGNQIRDKWRRIDEKTQQGAAAAMRQRIMQSRDKFEAFVKDIDLYHVNKPNPIATGQPKRNRLQEANPRTRNDIRGILDGLDGVLASGIYVFGNLDSIEMTARTGAYSLPFSSVAEAITDRIESVVNGLREYAENFQKNEFTGFVLEERLEPTRSSRSLREWLRDIRRRLDS
ncbi:hypothetical protein ASPVEDRAFT_147974 [Aspergillus versicolor CBS 583.65]|uniref:Uncharacterized protein n=1 Tax=Aspergillus versicolor CBS 583.65 TaxID=1036611 RepID=A0A1L9PBA0_ASPVE|nr:uncharacterized protein ASPVEDRAFT_147974 [Aspergillus versicolor CBS 583.65]OJI98788.1 hypothetical protein ASPVEDRAFT_147974 [Aspergillus versicolor CBS 583.65]